MVTAIIMVPELFLRQKLSCKLLHVGLYSILAATGQVSPLPRITGEGSRIQGAKGKRPAVRTREPSSRPPPYERPLREMISAGLRSSRESSDFIPFLLFFFLMKKCFIAYRLKSILVRASEDPMTNNLIVLLRGMLAT